MTIMARRGADRILAGNPFLTWSNDHRGYRMCDVAADAVTTRFRTVERVRTPDTPVVTAATATVAHGTPAITLT